MKALKKFWYDAFCKRSRLTNFIVNFDFCSSSDTVLLTKNIHVAVKENIFYLHYTEDDRWNLRTKLKEIYAKRFNKMSKDLLKKMRNSGYVKRFRGTLCKGKHIVSCDWYIDTYSDFEQENP